MRLSCLVLALSVPFLSASDWKADHPLPGVTVLRNESANWGRITTKGVLPMNAPAVVARKEFDLKALPPGIPANAGVRRQEWPLPSPQMALSARRA